MIDDGTKFWRRVGLAIVFVCLVSGCVAVDPSILEQSDSSPSGHLSPTPPAAVSMVGGRVESAPADDPGARSDTATPLVRWSAADWRAHVVVAIIDTGINPYHTEFRDDSPEAQRHPATYILGYPLEARELRLTLDALNLQDALRRDAATWKAVQPGVLYWVPGTRIVGMIGLSSADDRFAGARVGYDDDGHGTMTASRAAGATTSLAPQAKIVAVEGMGDENIEWAAYQPWIDLQSNSWRYTPGLPTDTERVRRAAATQPVFASAGNGVQGAGGVGIPASLARVAGAPGVIAVGGHDSGRPTPWSGSMPHVVADACASPAANPETLNGVHGRVGSGTSAAAPYVAGAAARILLEARTILGDANVHHEGGILASGTPSGVTDGPLMDGSFTLDELKDALLLTADPRPESTAHDGPSCNLWYAPYVTVPAEWRTVPEDVPTYYFMGYGAVNEHTLASALAVVRGDAPLPDRPDEDAYFAADERIRKAHG